MFRLVVAFVAGSLMAAACGSPEATPVSTTEVAIEIDAPTRPDIPWDETPEHLRANERCPEDLAVDSITPLDAPAVALTQVAEVAEASALVFAPNGTAFIGARSGSIFSWVEGSEPELVLDLT